MVGVRRHDFIVALAVGYEDGGEFGYVGAVAGGVAFDDERVLASQGLDSR